MSDSGNLATVPAAASGITTPLTDPPEPGRAVEVAPGVLWMRLPLPMALDHVNVYALEDDDGWTIVDTGLDTRKARAIWESLLSGPLSGRSVARVLITHYHPDHVGLAGWFQSRGAELASLSVATIRAVALGVVGVAFIQAIIVGMCLLIAGVTRSRSGALFFGAVLGIAGFVGAVQTESFKESLAIESSMAWLAVLAGIVIVLSALMLPRFARHSTVIEQV